MSFFDIVVNVFTVVSHSYEWERIGSVAFEVHLIPDILFVGEDILDCSSFPRYCRILSRYVFFVELVCDLTGTFTTGVVCVDSSDDYCFGFVYDESSLVAFIAVGGNLQ